jgi:uncharacterized protein YukE
MNPYSLNLECLESRTLLAALLDSETGDPTDQEPQTIDFEESLVLADATDTTDGEKHHKHGIKHKIASATGKIQDEFEHITETIKDKALHTLDKALEKAGEAIHSSETAMAITDEAIKITEKVLIKMH